MNYFYNQSKKLIKSLFGIDKLSEEEKILRRIEYLRTVIFDAKEEILFYRDRLEHHNLVPLLQLDIADAMQEIQELQNKLNELYAKY